MTNKTIDAAEFDAKFDRGEDITEYLDFSKAKRSGQEQKPVEIDFPVWMISALDSEARRLGVTREAIIKVWLAERLERVA